MKRKADSLYLNPQSKKKYVPLRLRQLQDIVRHPQNNAVYGIFAKPVVEYDNKNYLNDQQLKYVNDLYNKLGKVQLDINDMHYILVLYNNVDLYVSKDYNILINDDEDSCIIKCERGYYNVLIDHNSEALKVIDSQDDYDYSNDIERLSHYRSKLNRIIDYEVMVCKVKSNFKQASDILAVLVYMINKAGAYVSHFDLILMKDLLKEYIDRLKQNNYGILKDAFGFVATKNSKISSITYEERISNSLNFVLKIKDNYEYDEIRWRGKQKESNRNKLERIVTDFIEDHHLLTDRELVFLIHYISNNNYNIIDPCMIYTSRESKSRLNKINKSGVYYFPVCDKDYKHWTMWEVEYRKDISIDFNIYDSLTLYNNNDAAKGEVEQRTVELFEDIPIRNSKFTIVDTPVKQDSFDKYSCGFYTLFFLAARRKNLTISNIPNIESFNIKFFIEDLENGITSLSINEKAKLYYYFDRKSTLYKFI